jgi:membrane protein implicated in regulation of membrane protease activity
VSVLRDLRKLVLGETWVLPLGVAALLVAGLVLRAVAPDLWEDAGGFLLLGGVVALLAAASAGSATRRRDG